MSVRFNFACLLCLTGSLVLAQRPIHVTVNGQRVSFDHGRPMQSNGRVLVPLRGVFEKMGALVEWNSVARVVSATKDTTVVQLKIGDRNAMVNQRAIALDTPPRIVNGATMVPLRFVSEALGANVGWDANQNLVAISTNGTIPTVGAVHVERREMRAMLHANTVIPVTLVDALSSNNSHQGDTFSTVVQTNGAGAYAGVPRGSRIDGHVVLAKPQHGSDPGVLQLAFDRIRLPDGETHPIDGSLYSLDASSVSRGSDGVMVAKKTKANTKDPLVYVGYGAGAGTVLAVITKGNVLTDAVVGGAIGYLVHELDKSKNNPKNVNLAEGTTMGVRLNRPLSL